MRLLLLVCLGGGIGAGLRYLTGVWFAERGLGALPWATLTVNVAGSLLMGIIMGLLLGRFSGSPELRAFVATGILGGFTTFSAFSFDAVELWMNRAPVEAVGYVLASVLLSVGALVFSLWITTSLLRPVV